MIRIVSIDSNKRGEFIYLLSPYLKSDRVTFHDTPTGGTFDLEIQNDVPVIAKFNNVSIEPGSAVLKVECGGSFISLDWDSFSAISCF